MFGKYKKSLEFKKNGDGNPRLWSKMGRGVNKLMDMALWSLYEVTDHSMPGFKFITDLNIYILV